MEFIVTQLCESHVFNLTMKLLPVVNFNTDVGE